MLQRLTIVLALALTLGLAAAQDAGTTGWGGGWPPGNGGGHDPITDALEQDITVDVPTVMRLVIDEDLDAERLDSWRLDFDPEGKNDRYEGDACYVLPNWVGLDTTFTDFLAAAGGIDGLVPWEPGYGYPAIIPFDDAMTTLGRGFPGGPGGPGGPSTPERVALWNEVAPELGAYMRDGGVHPAKGNVACFNAFMVEKYTNNEDGATFYVSLDVDGHDGDGFGTLLIRDYQVASGQGVREHATLVGEVGYAAEDRSKTRIAEIEPHHFYDDYIEQWLDLTTSNPGKHEMTVTYTLSSAIAR